MQTSFIERFENGYQSTKEKLLESTLKIVNTQEIKPELLKCIRQKVVLCQESFDLVKLEKTINSNIVFDRYVNKNTILEIFKIFHNLYQKCIESVDTVIILAGAMPIACFVNENALKEKILENTITGEKNIQECTDLSKEILYMDQSSVIIDVKRTVSSFFGNLVDPLIITSLLAFSMYMFKKAYDVNNAKKKQMM